MDAPTRTHDAPAVAQPPTAVVPEWVHGLFPWRVVVLPWLLSRALSAVVVAVAGSSDGRLRFGGFFAWDGGWYEHIARFGYGAPPPDGVQTPWPFFPLLPGIVRGFDEVGIPGRGATVVLNHLVFLVALAGVYRLARRHTSAPASALAVWAIALFPGSFVFSMLYPSAIFLAGSVWAFLLVEDRHDAGASVLVVVVAMARPNGLVVAVALVFAVRSLPRAVLVAGPAVVAVGVWCALCWHWTGDPVVFFTAKSSWGEVTLGNLLFPIADYGAIVHFALGVSALAAVVAERRRLPAPWLVLTGVYLLPPLVLGVIGLGRYTNECFAPFVAFGNLLARLPAQLRALLLTASAAGLVGCAIAVLRHDFVP